eukprot:3238782-Prymnesium_polylepis.1
MEARILRNTCKRVVGRFGHAIISSTRPRSPRMTKVKVLTPGSIFQRASASVPERSCAGSQVGA